MTDAPRPGRPWVAGRSGWARAAKVLASVVALTLVAVVVTIWTIDRNIQRVDVTGLGEVPDDLEAGAPDAEPAEADVTEEDPDELTVLVLGSDTREGLTAEQRREWGTGEFDGERTEVIWLVRLDPDAGRIRVLAIPRDSRVERCDGSMGRINGAYEIGARDGGPGAASCTVQTVSALTGTAIDHVVTIDFVGFVDVVDRLGGVEMYLDEPLQDRNANLDLPAGCVRLDGVDALAFVRARQLDNDFGRIARQQRFVAELRDQLGELGVLADLPRLLRVADAVARAVELDSSLDLGTIQRLVREHRSTLQGDLDTRSVPGEITEVHGASVVELDEEELRELSRWLRTGQDDDAPDGAGSPDGDGSAAEPGGGATAGERGGPGSSGGPAGTDPSGSC